MNMIMIPPSYFHFFLLIGTDYSCIYEKNSDTNKNKICLPWCTYPIFASMQPQPDICFLFVFVFFSCLRIKVCAVGMWAYDSILFTGNTKSHLTSSSRLKICSISLMCSLVWPALFMNRTGLFSKELSLLAKYIVLNIHVYCNIDNKAQPIIQLSREYSHENTCPSTMFCVKRLY